MFTYENDDDEIWFFGVYRKKEEYRKKEVEFLSMSPSLAQLSG